MNACPFHHTLRTDLPPLTQRLAKLPIDERGYPVPFFVSWVDGKPEFRIADGRKMVRCVREKLCWTCGEKLGKYMTFAIGPMCAINRISAEPPSHKDCCEWSVKGCPFLSKPKMKRREDDFMRQTAEENPPAGVMLERNPGVTLLWTTLSYKPIPDHNKKVLFSIGEPQSTSWWREGRAATRAEIMESIETGLPLLKEQCDCDEAFVALEKARLTTMKLLPL